MRQTLLSRLKDHNKQNIISVFLKNFALMQSQIKNSFNFTINRKRKNE